MAQPLQKLLTADDTKNYLMETIAGDLVTALTEMCLVQPPNPHQWLADYLLKLGRDKAIRRKSFGANGVPPAASHSNAEHHHEHHHDHDHEHHEHHEHHHHNSHGHDHQHHHGNDSAAVSVEEPPPPPPSEANGDTETKAHPEHGDQAGHRVLGLMIAGPPASGKGTQCELLVKNYGVVHISTGDLLREAVRQGTPVGTQAKEFMDQGLLVPDDLIIKLVKDRLSQNDCQTRGWLLDGFPRTRAQADALKEAGIHPDHFILLEAPEQLLIERVVGRRTDPVTGRLYHLTFSPPENDEIAQRLVQRSDDTEDKLRVRLQGYNENINAIIDCYTEVTARVDSSQDKHAVNDIIERVVGAPPTRSSL